MWGASDVKLRISIKMRGESVWRSALLSLCLSEASSGAAASALRTKDRGRRGGAHPERSRFLLMGELVLIKASAGGSERHIGFVVRPLTQSSYRSDFWV